MTQQKTALVLGAGGFIGSHMVKRLIKEGYWVRGVDIKYPEFSETMACLLYTSPSPRDLSTSRMPSSA